MLENINYKILNPGGNITALVLGTDYTKEEMRKINDEILGENTKVEQVGFLDRENNRLEMAGGEFCVNATRCAIYSLLDKNEGDIEISVSGYKEKIKGGMLKDNKVYAKLSIEEYIENIIKNEDEFNVVYLDGITLLVLNVDDSREYIKMLNENEEKTKKYLKDIMSNFVTNSEAIGIILLEEVQNKIKINPIIWVKTIDTLYYETACGSGSIAAALYLNKLKKITKMDILQPSGYSLNVKINTNGNYIKSCVIDGIVEEVL